MQLTNKRNIAGALAVASCGLITQGVQADEKKLNEVDDWNVDAALMYYGEQDRVTAVEAIADVDKRFSDTSTLNMKLVIDSLTGSSASGAIAQPSAQTFTRPSGKGEYTVKPGETPLDDTFQDTRIQLSTNWTEKLDEKWTVNGGVYGSTEYDYLSLGINAGFERTFNKNNTTLSFGTSYTFDQLDPVGNKPIALAKMALRSDYPTEAEFQAAFDQSRDGTTDDKDTLDLMVGVTQILNRNWLMQFNYGLSSVSGYLNDPYKILSEIDENGATQNYRYENRPDSRVKHNFFVLAKGALDTGVVDFSYRYSTDDWDVTSHTLETHYRYYFSPKYYAQLHLRYYQQEAAEFYQPFLREGEALPKYASADYRIGEMDAYTIGFKFGQALSNGHELSYRLEYYQQNPKNNGTTIPTGLQGQDLFPEVKAIIAQINYSF